MTKTEKELQELKEKVEEVKKELMELSEEELNQVAGGEIKTENMFQRYDELE